MNSIGRPRVYEDSINVTISMERKDVALLDTLRGSTPRGRYISIALYGTEDIMLRCLNAEEMLKMHAAVADRNNLLIKTHERTIAVLNKQLSAKEAAVTKMMENLSAKDAEISRLNLEVKRASLQPSAGDGAVDIMRREFLDRNIEIVQGFVMGRISHENLLFFQKTLAFTSLHKLKTFFIEEYQRRLNDGSIEPAEKALAKLTPSPAPIKPLSTEQQAFKDELLGKIKELRNKFTIVKKEVNAAMARGDAQTVNTIGPQEHLLEDQLLEAMKTAKAAGETGFNRPISEPQPSAQPLSTPEIKVETPCSIPENTIPTYPATPASSITYEGKTAAEMLAEVREWDKQEKDAVDSLSPAAGDSVKGTDGISTEVDVKFDAKG